ncbi:MAG: class I SAM-dependent methyltransferase [Promethearchaeota archaeon]|nr:MAG: class I SAM-dependent methyltransferase [Candidatus Lokiarchaeota archaeon]
MTKKSDWKKKKKQIMLDYNLSSEFYDQRYMEIQKEKYELILENLISNPKLNLKAGILLDAGCGTGLLHQYLMKSMKQKDFKNFHYIGMDISINMLTQFRLKLSKQNLDKKADLLLSDIEHLPIRNSVIDILFCITSLQNLPGIDKGISESFRTIKNGAIVNFSVLKKKFKISTFKEKIEKMMTDKIFLNIDGVEDIIYMGRASKE